MAIITALGQKGITGTVCDPPDNGTQYEFTPYEFGSWGNGVKAFTPTKSLGTLLTNGIPPKNGCVQNYDNLGYILGTSSSKFQEACGQAGISIIASGLEPILAAANGNQTTKPTAEEERRKLYAPYKNPFYKRPESPLVADDTELFLLDGGEGKQLLSPINRPY